MNQTIIISLPKKERERLSQLALRYGLSLSEFSQRVLKELSSTFPAESFEDYKNPKELQASFHQALKDLREGRVSDRL